MLYFLCLWGVLELVVMILVAAKLGAMMTLALLVLGAIAGSFILQRERQHFLQRMQRGDTGFNSDSVKDGLFRVMGGTLLFMPGFLSDILAVVCMIPALRGIFGGMLLKMFRPDVVVQRFGYRQGNVYEGEFSTKSTDSADTVRHGEFIPHDDKSPH